MIENLLERFDNESNEIVVRWRLWKMRWFPYRTAELLGMSDEPREIILGPWEWNRPRALRKRKAKP